MLSLRHCTKYRFGLDGVSIHVTLFVRLSASLVRLLEELLAILLTRSLSAGNVKQRFYRLIVV
jgi:hypothetical protein